MDRYNIWVEDPYDSIDVHLEYARCYHGEWCKAKDVKQLISDWKTWLRAESYHAGNEIYDEILDLFEAFDD